MIHFDQGMDLWHVARKVTTPFGRNMSKLALQLETANPSLQARMAQRPAVFRCVLKEGSGKRPACPNPNRRSKLEDLELEDRLLCCRIFGKVAATSDAPGVLAGGKG